MNSAHDDDVVVVPFVMRALHNTVVRAGSVACQVAGGGVSGTQPRNDNGTCHCTWGCCAQPALHGSAGGSAEPFRRVHPQLCVALELRGWKPCGYGYVFMCVCVSLNGMCARVMWSLCTSASRWTRQRWRRWMPFKGSRLLVLVCRYAVYREIEFK